MFLQLINGAVLFGDDLLNYFQDNGWGIVAILITLYLLKNHVITPFLDKRNFRPEEIRQADYQDRMRKIRLQQQELAHQRAIEAAKRREQEEREEKDRKNNLHTSSPSSSGKRLGGGGGGGSTKSSRIIGNSSYNALDPSSSHTSGYKPARRCLPRGGG
mmetsp:Transcript_23284/g.33374  ORF Transcript_23284/g.33374 Transcript_23284/m.33374 type:complete len:159 (-) Transcript_23284:279-755(-)